MRTRRYRLFAAAAALLPAPAAAEPPLRLQALEAEYERALAGRHADLESRYRAALEPLEEEFKRAGDLDGILALRAELEALDTAAAARPAPRPLELPLSQAELVGGARHDPDNALLSGWRSAGAAASWSLAGLDAAPYALEIECFAGPFGGGLLEVRAPGLNTTVEIQSGASWAETRTIEIGSLQPSGQAAPQLTLRATSTRHAGLFDLLTVRLVRADTAAAVAAPR